MENMKSEESFHDVTTGLKKDEISIKNPPFLDEIRDEKEASRSKTADRIKYEAEVEVIRRQIGDLEQVRLHLGLSRRKMCQLLLVDPSAWTRWEKTEAPPHIYRALQWYMISLEKIPGLSHHYFLGRDFSKMEKQIDEWMRSQIPQPSQESLENKKLTISLSNEVIGLKTSLEQLRDQLQKQSEYLSLLHRQKKSWQFLVFSLMMTLIILLGWMARASIKL